MKQRGIVIFKTTTDVYNFNFKFNLKYKKSTVIL